MPSSTSPCRRHCRLLPALGASEVLQALPPPLHVHPQSTAPSPARSMCSSESPAAAASAVVDALPASFRADVPAFPGASSARLSRPAVCGSNLGGCMDARRSPTPTPLLSASLSRCVECALVWLQGSSRLSPQVSLLSELYFNVLKWDFLVVVIGF